MALSMNKKQFRKQERIEIIKRTIGLKEDENFDLILNTIEKVKTEVTDENITGIIDGDGSFWVSFEKKNISTGFSITVDNETIPLIEIIRTRFRNKGSIIKKKQILIQFM